MSRRSRSLGDEPRTGGSISAKVSANVSAKVPLRAVLTVSPVAHPQLHALVAAAAPEVRPRLLRRLVVEGAWLAAGHQLNARSLAPMMREPSTSATAALAQNPNADPAQLAAALAPPLAPLSIRLNLRIDPLVEAELAALGGHGAVGTGGGAAHVRSALLGAALRAAERRGQREQGLSGSGEVAPAQPVRGAPHPSASARVGGVVSSESQVTRPAQTKPRSAAQPGGGLGAIGKDALLAFVTDIRASALA